MNNKIKILPQSLSISIVIFAALILYSADGEKVNLPKSSQFLQAVEQGRAKSSAQYQSHSICGSALLPPDTILLKDPKSGYPTINIRIPQDDVGDIRTFNAVDFTNENQEVKQIVARAESKGRHAYIYVDTTATYKAEDLEDILAFFDDHIYDRNIQVFGSEPRPGIDGDFLITILFLEIETPENITGDIAGYFWPVNQSPKSENANSNEREMLYVDIGRLTRFGVEDVLGTIAHEMQHLIHWNHDRNEETWINEGLAEYAIFVNELPLNNPPNLFLDDTDNNLTNWTGQPRDYARSFLWFLYLADHYGGNSLIRNIVANSGKGMTALQSVLISSGMETTTDEIFSNWIVANYLDGISAENELYEYKSMRLGPLRPTQIFGFLPVSTRAANVNAYAADYYLFNGGENLVLHIDGPNLNPNFQVKGIKIFAHAPAQVIDIPLDNVGRGDWPLPEFGISFNKFVLVPYYLQKPTFGALADYKFDAEGTGGPSAFVDTLQYHDTDSRLIISLGLPSPLINSNHFDSYAVRFTPHSDGNLLSMEFALWNRIGSDGAVRIFVYTDSGDSVAVPLSKVDSVDVSDATGTPSTITWNRVDFSGKNVSVKKGEDFHLAMEFVDHSLGDTVFAILDTAKVSTNRSSVYVREEQRWAHFVGGFNFFMRAMVSIPADPTVPQITSGILQNPVFNKELDIFAISEKSLNPSSVEGTFTLNDSSTVLHFVAVDDSNKVFIEDDFHLFGDGPATLVVSGRHAYGTIAGTDTLSLNVDFINYQTAGTVTSSDEYFQLHLIENTLVGNTYFTTFAMDDNFQLNENEKLLASDLIPTGLAYTVAPDGITFEKMVELQIYYADNETAMLSENDLEVAFWDDGRWVLLGGELYREKKYISVLVNRTGNYQLVAKKYQQPESENPAPIRFYLQQNYPNPFNPKTTIKFGLPRTVHTIIRIINLKGQIISVLVDEVQNAGEHIIEWDGTDDKNVRVASGVYLYQIQADDFVDTRKLVLVK